MKNAKWKTGQHVPPLAGFPFVILALSFPASALASVQGQPLEFSARIALDKDCGWPL
jgi:hypothetical protein